MADGTEDPIVTNPVPTDPSPADPAPVPDPLPEPLPVPPFTYGDPSLSPIWSLRFAIGDTVEKTAFLTDAELNYLLLLARGDEADAAVSAVLKIMGQLARLCDETVGSVSKSWSQMRDGYKDLLADLRRLASSSGGGPFVGGISKMANRRPYANNDTVRPQFGTRMMTYRRGARSGVPGIIDDTGDDDLFGPR